MLMKGKLTQMIMGSILVAAERIHLGYIVVLTLVSIAEGFFSVSWVLRDQFWFKGPGHRNRVKIVRHPARDLITRRWSAR
jgi:hypothetical protein